MKIVTYNVNGIRSAQSKGLLDWLRSTDADVVCLQEIKASLPDIDQAAFTDLGYFNYWYPAQKKGYSGVAILTKKEPKHVAYGSGLTQFDAEGRFIRADFDDLSVMSLYAPSGSSGEERQQVKFEFMDAFLPYAAELQQQLPKLVMCGDYNICHEAIDIHDPKGNAKSSGFLPEERAWFGELLASGWTDSFRHQVKEPHHYTWWSFRAGARANNKGWRIDYILTSKALQNQLGQVAIYPNAVHSDHCPSSLTLLGA